MLQGVLAAPGAGRGRHDRGGQGLAGDSRGHLGKGLGDLPAQHGAEARQTVFVVVLIFDLEGSCVTGRLIMRD